MRGGLPALGIPRAAAGAALVASVLVAALPPPALGAPPDRASPAARSDVCALVDDPRSSALLSGALETMLLVQCRGLKPRLFNSGSIGDVQVAQTIDDVRINDPSTDFFGFIQSETSLAVANGTVCIGWNDSGEMPRTVFSDFASTTGGGAFTDGAGFPLGPAEPAGDPSLAHRELDGAFYHAALIAEGLGLWRSLDGCQSWEWVGPIHAEGDRPDKEIMAVDNNPPSRSPWSGRIYVAYSRFFTSSTPASTGMVAWTDDPTVEAPLGSWAGRSVLPGTEARLGQGLWPAVAPNGDVYVALLDRNVEPGGTQDQWIYRSSDGGQTWQRRTDIASDLPRPEDDAASAACNRTALNGGLRHLASPQIAITPDPAAEAGYTIHAVYAYDSDGEGPDDSNVFYRRSTDAALTWSDEFRLNDDATTTDQWYPALGANSRGTVVASWYDRRLDPARNLSFDRYLSVSTDGGLGWSPNLRITDSSSPVARTDVSARVSLCYHGDYDQVAVEEDDTVHVVWSDDRTLLPPCPVDPNDPDDPFAGGCPDPDVYYQRLEDVDRDGVLDALDSCPSVPDVGDLDSDGVDDACDTCLGLPNPALADPTTVDPAFPNGWMTLVSGQRDDDADGVGNACDADFDNVGARVGGRDLNLHRKALHQRRDGATACEGPCAIFDMDGFGVLIGEMDVLRGRQRFHTTPGPSCTGPDEDDDTIALPCDPNPTEASGVGAPDFFSRPGFLKLNRAVCEGRACP